MVVLIACMDGFIQFQIAVMRRQGIVVAYGSAVAQDSMAEPIPCDHPNLGLWNSHLTALLIKHPGVVSHDIALTTRAR